MFRRDDMQKFLDVKAKKEKLSYSIVAHLRWDLKQIFDLALSEGIVERNPALLLFVPREAKKPVWRAMTIKEVRLCFHGSRETGTAHCETGVVGWDEARRDLRFNLAEIDGNLRGYPAMGLPAAD